MMSVAWRPIGRTPSGCAPEMGLYDLRVSTKRSSPPAMAYRRIACAPPAKHPMAPVSSGLDFGLSRLVGFKFVPFSAIPDSIDSPVPLSSVRLTETCGLAPTLAFIEFTEKPLNDTRQPKVWRMTIFCR